MWGEATEKRNQAKASAKGKAKPKVKAKAKVKKDKTGPTGVFAAMKEEYDDDDDEMDGEPMDSDENLPEEELDA